MHRINTSSLVYSNLYVNLNTGMEYDTWLREKDIERIWKIVDYELPDYFCSKEELQEFNRILAHIIPESRLKKFLH